MRGLIVPRPLMVLANGLLFSVGVILALVEGTGREAVGGMPLLLFILLWFFVQEILVQQAKYMWNDLRDHEGDQEKPANQGRAVTRLKVTRVLYFLMLGRWGLGILLAWILSPSLLVIVLLISVLQIVYEYAAKPQAGRWPFFPLFVAAASTVLKSTSGALAAGYDVGNQRLWLYGLGMFSTGVVYVSAFWRTEADYFYAKGRAVVRAQSNYFRRSGQRWLRAGATVGMYSGLLLLVDAYEGFLGQTDLDTAQVMILIFSAGALLTSLSYGLVRGKKGSKLVLWLGAVLAAAWLLSAGSSVIWPLPQSAVAALLFILLLVIDYRFNYSADYKKQNLIYLGENWPGWRPLLNEWKRPLYLLKVIWSLNSAHPQEIVWYSRRLSVGSDTAEH